MKNQDIIINRVIEYAKTLGAWIMWLILCALPVVALWLALWVGYASGLKM